ncbi:hypothetical protein SUGI_0733000 [Cryptomeria japonica]|nr:hypothetical protein SUGI_0733000 [Cryptomeria japonica]
MFLEQAQNPLTGSSIFLAWSYGGASNFFIYISLLGLCQKLCAESKVKEFGRCCFQTMSQTTRFQLAGNFSKQKKMVEKVKMPGIETVELGEHNWVTFVHDPSTTDAQLRSQKELMMNGSTTDAMSIFRD